MERTIGHIPVQNRNVFLSRGAFRSIPNSNRWVVTEEIRYLDPEGNLIVVPVGFETDFASVPSLARIFGALLALLIVLGRIFESLKWICLACAFLCWLVVMMAEWLENSGTDEIAAVHDWIYGTRCRPRWKGDWILYCGMDAKGATRNGKAKSFLFWLNVRMAGWWPWIQDKKNVKRNSSLSK